MRLGPMIVLLELLSLATANGYICPRKCICTDLTSSTLKVDCSLRKLENLPSFPNTTEELCLQQNLLTSIPSGTFDNLKNLKKLNLSYNPLHCDCHIWYLKMWLDDQRLDKDNSTKCLTPRSLYGKPVTELSGTQVTSCSRRVTLCSDFIFNDAFLFALLFLSLLLMILCLKTFKMMKFKLEVSDDDVTFPMKRAPRVRSLKRSQSC
ncbi:hypothetical protein FKM82_004255 [Ascaphus truei]|uniref:platelet glycoprotein IX-like n=1 Tax=Ascaphus truei TaxID=8439 RepID=UPI003F596154